MSVESETKIIKRVIDSCSTGEPFKLKELTMDDIYNFTLASTAYSGMRQPIKLRPYQLKPAWRVVQSVVDDLGLEIVAMFSRQSGKTTSLPGATLHFLCSLPSIYEPMTAGFKAGVFGPKKEQADLAFNMFKFFLDTNFLHDMLGIKQVVNNAREVRLTNRTTVYSESASTNATIEGLTLDLAFIEEAQNVDDVRILNSIYPMCASTNGTRVLTGSPTPERLGYFHQISSRAGKDVFLAPWTEAAKHSKKYDTFVRREKKKHGPNSDYFRTQYELEWVTLNAAFCTIDELMPLRSGNTVLTTDVPVVAGLDPARISDSTVLTVISLTKKPHVCLWFESQGDKYTQQAEDVKTILHNFPNLKMLYIDVFGGGLAIKDLLPDDIPCAMIHMNSPTQTKMWTHVREAIVGEAGEGRFTYPDVEDVERYRFEEQMTMLQAKYSAGQFKVAAPGGTKYHDDYADSFALAWYAVMNSGQTFGDTLDSINIATETENKPKVVGGEFRPKGFNRPTSMIKR